MKTTIIIIISMCTLVGAYAQVPDSLLFPDISFLGDEPEWLYKVQDASRLGIAPSGIPGSSIFSISDATSIFEVESVLEDDVLYTVYDNFVALENWGPLLIGLDVNTGEEVFYKSYNPAVLDARIVPTNMTYTPSGEIQILGTRCRQAFDSTHVSFGCVGNAGVPIRMKVDATTGDIQDTFSLSQDDGGVFTGQFNGNPDIIEFVEDSLYMLLTHIGGDTLIIKADLLSQGMQPLDTSKYIFANNDVGLYNRIPEAIKLETGEVVALAIDSRVNWSPAAEWAFNELIWFNVNSEVTQRLRIDSFLVNPVGASMVLDEGKLIITARSLAAYGQSTIDYSVSILVVDAVSGEVLENYQRLQFDGNSYSRAAAAYIPDTDKMIVVGESTEGSRIDILSAKNGDISLLKSTELQAMVDNAESISFFATKLFVTEEGNVLAKCIVQVMPNLGRFSIDLGYDLSGALTSTEVLSEPTTFELYPNPASDYIQLSGGGAAEVRLTTMQGQLVRTYRDQNASRLDVSDLPEGPYVCTIRAEDGSVETHKLMVMR